MVLDIGGVLSAPEGGVPELAAHLGLDEGVFAAAFWRHRDDYDRGGALLDYWSRVGTDLGLELSAADAHRLDDLDARRWGTPAPASAALLADVLATGTTVAILSNAPASMAAVVRGSSWSSGVHRAVFSCDLGVAKPAPAAYRAVEEALGRPGSDLVFFDDRPVNVEGARARGWDAHLWVGAPRAREVLAGLGVLGVDGR